MVSSSRRRWSTWRIEGLPTSSSRSLPTTVSQRARPLMGIEKTYVDCLQWYDAYTKRKIGKAQNLVTLNSLEKRRRIGSYSRCFSVSFGVGLEFFWSDAIRLDLLWVYLHIFWRWMASLVWIRSALDGRHFWLPLRSSREDWTLRASITSSTMICLRVSMSMVSRRLRYSFLPANVPKNRASLPMAKPIPHDFSTTDTLVSFARWTGVTWNNEYFRNFSYGKHCPVAANLRFQLFHITVAVYRIGRSGRIGNAGRSTSFIEPGLDRAMIRPLINLLTEVSYLF